MSDVNSILKRRKFGDAIVDVINENNDKIKDTPLDTDTTQQENQVPSLNNAKNKILSTNQLDNLIDGIKYFDSQATTSFFYLSHCFYKIREDKLFTQKGYTSFVDFINMELKNFSMKSVYNYLNMAETFPLEETPIEILQLGSTKLSDISKIKDKVKRLDYVKNNLEEIKTMSTRELKSKVNDINNADKRTLLTNNIQNSNNNVQHDIFQWKELTNKLNAFLDEIDINNLNSDKFIILKDELNEMEEKLKDIQNKLNKKIVIDYKNDQIDNDNNL
jgi:hypothetical protein